MYAMTILADAAFLRAVHVKIMQVLITVSKSGRFAGPRVNKGILIVAVKAEGKVSALVGSI